MVRQQLIFFIGLITCFMIMAAQAYAVDCKASPQMGMGTHSKPVSQHKTDIGHGLKVKAVILSAQTCSPIENARIEHWQMNSEGEYIDELRAYLMSDANGEIAFETEWPGSDVSHIHCIIYAEGYKTLTGPCLDRYRKNKKYRLEISPGIYKSNDIDSID